MRGELSTNLEYSGDTSFVQEPYLRDSLALPLNAIVEQLPSTMLERQDKVGVDSLDDFCVFGQPATMYGADFVGGKVVKFLADGSSAAECLCDGLQSPTSVRQGSGPGWDDPNSVFIRCNARYHADLTLRIS